MYFLFYRVTRFCRDTIIDLAVLSKVYPLCHTSTHSRSPPTNDPSQFPSIHNHFHLHCMFPFGFLFQGLSERAGWWQDTHGYNRAGTEWKCILQTPHLLSKFMKDRNPTINIGRPGSKTFKMSSEMGRIHSTTIYQHFLLKSISSRPPPSPPPPKKLSTIKNTLKGVHQYKHFKMNWMRVFCTGFGNSQ